MSGDYKEFGYSGNGDAQDVLSWALDVYSPDIALACSFQNPLLVHMMVGIKPDIRVFGIDTGRLNEETYQCADAIEKMFGVKIEWFLPNNNDLEKLVGSKGQYSFRESLDARRQCCAVRKVEPLNRALSGLRAWITGVRREQNITRESVGKIEKDLAHGGIIKINPIADWSSDQVRDYIIKYDLPYNKLLDCGYSSIGCAPCTRAINTGEHPRSGRWWWEQEEHKECGLHVRDWSI